MTWMIQKVMTQAWKTSRVSNDAFTWHALDDLVHANVSAEAFILGLGLLLVRSGCQTSQTACDG